MIKFELSIYMNDRILRYADRCIVIIVIVITRVCWFVSSFAGSFVCCACYIRQVNRVKLADILFSLLYVRLSVCAHDTQPNLE